MTTSADLVRAARASGVEDDRVLEAIGTVPRAEFVPPDLAAYAYHDRPLPIPHGQVTTQPSLVAQMVAALELTRSDRLLEIGTGFGWQTALLARLAGEVWSVERWEDIARMARVHLEQRGVENATVVVGDGSAGLPEHAPFDGILVAAAPLTVPETLLQQLRVGGRLIVPVGPEGEQELIRFTRREQKIDRVSLGPVAFVPLLGGIA
jgi:protein-L-isoaspartate(D-aspartate) O-methyltransferase